jgi:hypothetical protein
MHWLWMAVSRFNAMRICYSIAIRKHWTCPAAERIPSAPVGQFNLIAQETFCASLT